MRIAKMELHRTCVLATPDIRVSMNYPMSFDAPIVIHLLLSFRLRSRRRVYLLKCVGTWLLSGRANGDKNIPTFIADCTVLSANL